MTITHIVTQDKVLILYMSRVVKSSILVCVYNGVSLPLIGPDSQSSCVGLTYPSMICVPSLLGIRNLGLNRARERYILGRSVLVLPFLV